MAVKNDNFTTAQYTQCWVTLELPHMSLVLRKPDFCICENKDADQLRGNREADQRLCFRYTDSTIPPLPKSEISSFYPSTVAVQPGLYRTWWKTPKTVFSERGSYKSGVRGSKSHGHVSLM